MQYFNYATVQNFVHYTDCVLRYVQYRYVDYREISTVHTTRSITISCQYLRTYYSNMFSHSAVCMQSVALKLLQQFLYNVIGNTEQFCVGS